MPKKKAPVYSALSSAIHSGRFFRNKHGESIEEIAAAEGVSVKAVKRSIESVNLYRSRNTHEQVNTILSHVVLEVGNQVRQALNEALGATFVVKDGDKTVHEPDHNTRMKAVGEVRQIAQVVQPKSGPSTNVTVGVGVTQQTRVASGGYIGMEDRLRQIRQDRLNKPEIEGKTVAVAELEQPGGDFSLGAGDEDDGE